MNPKILETIKKWTTILDLPSGVVLGLHSLIVIGLSVAAFIAKRAIDTSIITVYGINLSWYAGHRISSNVTTLLTQNNVDAPVTQTTATVTTGDQK